MIDTFQQRLANRQEAHNLMTEYDMDHSGREKNLWEEALEVIRSTTIAERTISYITLNRPEPEPSGLGDDENTLPSEVILKNLTLPAPVTRPVRTGNEPPQQISPHIPLRPEMEWPE